MLSIQSPRGSSLIHTSRELRVPPTIDFVNYLTTNDLYMYIVYKSDYLSKYLKTLGFDRHTLPPPPLLSLSLPPSLSLSLISLLDVDRFKFERMK